MGDWYEWEVCCEWDVGISGRFGVCVRLGDWRLVCVGGWYK